MCNKIEGGDPLEIGCSFSVKVCTLPIAVDDDTSGALCQVTESIEIISRFFR